MRKYDYVLVDVFTKVRLQGNPLAVFPSADDISDGEMQKIARELNLSDTAFLLKPSSSASAAKVRIFTPRRELDFAGHPTLGSAYVLTRNAALGDHFVLDENVGAVTIDTDNDADGWAIFWLTTPKLTFYETMDRQVCARLLNLDESDIATDAPPQFVSAGSPLLFICVTSPEVVDRAEVQQSYLWEALGSVNSVGTFVFARKEPQSANRDSGRSRNQRRYGSTRRLHGKVWTPSKIQRAVHQRPRRQDGTPQHLTRSRCGQRRKCLDQNWRLRGSRC